MMGHYDTGYNDGYAAAIEEVRQLHTEERLSGNRWSAALDALLSKRGLVIDMRTGLWIQVAGEKPAF